MGTTEGGPPSYVRNPVVPGFHPDPSVCQVGEHYYLTNSTFGWAPGLPLFHSTDLVAWQQVGNILDRDTQLDLSGAFDWGTSGVYAPTLRHHDDRFWAITTVLGVLGPRNIILTAADATGPWSDPVPIDVVGIDPDLAWADGRCFVHFSGDGGIKRCEIDPETGDVLTEPTPTWSGTGLQFPEAPHLYLIDGTWYLLIAEGGTERGHAVSVARSHSPAGPWEPCPHNPILSHRSTNEPIQSTGHGDLVQAPDGTWAMVVLGTRPGGVSPGYHVLGRETFLTSVRFRDGWPHVDAVNLDAVVGDWVHNTQPSWDYDDDFAASSLDPGWMSPLRQASLVADLNAQAGALTLRDDSTSLDDLTPTFVGRRQRHLTTETSVLVEADNGHAGLALVIDHITHARIELWQGRIAAHLRIGPASSSLGERSWAERSARLAIVTTSDWVGPDRVRLGYLDDGDEFVELASLDGRYLSTEVAGGFTGRLIGMFVSRGAAAFREFRYRGTLPEKRPGSGS